MEDSSDYSKRPLYQYKVAEALERKRSEIETRKKERFEKSRIKTTKRLQFIAWLQILGSIIFLVSHLLFFYSYYTTELLVINITLVVFFSSLSFFAGYNLLKRKKAGYVLTAINQLFQLTNFDVSGLLYSYATIGGIYISASLWDELAIKQKILFIPRFQFQIQNSNALGDIYIDIISVLFLIVLYSEKNYLKSY